MNKIEICKQIQGSIKKLSDNEIMEIFKIISLSNSNYTKNNNGIFLNLNWVDDETLQKIHNYICFCIKSQNEISKYEMMKTLLNDSIKYKETEIENIVIKNDIIEISSNNILSSKQKISSSMKFYLLKKKFLKQNSITVNYITENELSYENYLLT